MRSGQQSCLHFRYIARWTPRTRHGCVSTLPPLPFVLGVAPGTSACIWPAKTPTVFVRSRTLLAKASTSAWLRFLLLCPWVSAPLVWLRHTTPKNTYHPLGDKGLCFNVPVVCAEICALM